ncbi:MAG: transketolase [Ignavibacteriaceae bacterium]|nr:transketolase [Ignavibacteriaceae bacterium]
MESTPAQLDNLAVNTIRFLAAEGVQKANSGHPGMPMGCAPIAYYLYAKEMKHNPANPKWLNRDRFVLSAGHGSMLLYSILHLTGYNLPMEQLKQFRQWNSITPGHPEFGVTDGVETTTGPLGQGFANAVGMAMAQARLAAMFNKPDMKLLDHYIYGICSDGDLMEGVSHEAASLAGHLKLGKIIFFYDDNGITIDGETHLAFSENIELRFKAYGWHTEHISDVNDLGQIESALKKCQAQDKPSLIITKTHIGYGSPNKQDTESAHGSPLGTDEIKLTKQNLGWPYEEEFYIPEEVSALFSSLKKKYEEHEKKWNVMLSQYRVNYPQEAELFEKVMSGSHGTDWMNDLPVYKDDGKKLATRQASGNAINAIAKKLPALFGGSADLAPSNNTMMKGESGFSKDNYAGRNLHFGIREHAMGSLMNGMAYYGGLIVYGGTFLQFSDYLRPVLRLAALSHIKNIYIFTHDSIGLGEDGPTHQPVEHLASLRAIPGVTVIRPGDANETSAAWKAAILHKGGPVCLILSRQGMQILDQEIYPKADNLLKGAYILKDTSGKPDVILLASGSEVGLALDSLASLEKEGIKARVVSFPCWEFFEKQDQQYKDTVLPPDVKNRIVIEAGISMGWSKYAGDKGEFITIEKFGASAPEKVLMKEYGFTVENVVAKAKKLTGK